MNCFQFPFSPGRPPKNYNEKFAIGLFACRNLFYVYKCFELLRAKTTSKGEDIYIIPIPPFMVDGFHESIHSAHIFHWKWGNPGKYVTPLYGKQDMPAAIKLKIKMDRNPCLCLRKGRKLTEKNIELLLSRLSDYLPFTINLYEVSIILYRRGFYRFKRV